MVTRLGQAAVLVQLPGAHFAAAAAVQDDADAGCAFGHLQRTLTHEGAGGGGEDLYSQQSTLPLNTEAFSCHTKYPQNYQKSIRISSRLKK